MNADNTEFFYMPAILFLCFFFGGGVELLSCYCIYLVMRQLQSKVVKTVQQHVSYSGVGTYLKARAPIRREAPFFGRTRTHFWLLKV